MLEIPAEKAPEGSDIDPSGSHQVLPAFEGRDEGEDVV
jgi:hypothetical protein